MKIENEITVQVNTSLEDLDNDLKIKGFEVKEEYVLNDTYMINKSIDLNSLAKLEILQRCILIRDIVDIEKDLVYKYKKYDTDGSILEQWKIKCPILEVSKAISFMEAINYKTLFEIKDKCIVYANDKDELIVQLVNNKHIFIEVEDECSHIDKKYKDIEEMKKSLEQYNLNYDRNNYFVKKGEIILTEVLNKE